MADQRFFFLDLRPAGVIDGGSKKAGHVLWAELDDWSFTMKQDAKPNVAGGQPDKTAASGSFEFTIKHVGPALFKAASSAMFIPGPITFEAERAGLTGGNNGVYFQLLFNESVISARTIAGDEGKKTEHIRIVFKKVTMTYRQVISGVLQAPITKMYDAKTSSTAA